MNNEDVSYDSNETLQVNQSEDTSPFKDFRNEFQSSMPDSMARQLAALQLSEEQKQEFFVSGGESLLSKMGGMILAKAFLPSGAHIKEALTYSDIALKTEIVLHELYTTMFWFSLMELCLFLLGLVLFFSDPEEMYSFWIHILHIGRGIVGLVITKQMPKPHQMAANMSIPPNEKLTFQAILNYVVMAARDALKSFVESSRRRLIIYFVFTVICLLLDIIQFFKIVASFARLYSAFADLALIVIACLFLFIDWFYIMWIVSLSYKFPSHISTGAIKGFFGVMESLNSRMGEYLQRQKNNYDHAYRTGAARYSYSSNQRGQIGEMNQRNAAEENYPRPQNDTQE